MARRLRRGLVFSHAIHRCFRDFRFRQSKAARPLFLRERSEWLTEACRRVLDSLDVKVITEGKMPASGLIVSNHLSYLDILCYGSIAPSIFVSKEEVRSWPVFGRLATNGGTIYVDRSSKADAHRVANEIEQALRDGIRVVLFPEGTSTGGETVLRFHAPLFESAVRASSPITPACISYEIAGGDPARDVCYWGDMTFATHFLGLLRKGNVLARANLGHPRTHLADRKEAARQLHADVLKLHARLHEHSSYEIVKPQT